MLHASIDTCCLLNLLAGEPILPSFLSPGSDGQSEQLTFHVPSQVAQEAKWILRPAADDPSKLEKVDIELAPHYSSGVLVDFPFETDDELSSFVSLASSLDDGEAACLAIAASRHWLVATDDRVACRLAVALGVSVISTPQIVKQWANRSEASAAELSSVLRAIQRCARFVPHHTSPDHSWWMESM